MRTIITGTPTQLEKVRDLPLDLTHSFFEYVDLSNLDLSKHDLRDATLYHCNASGVTLGEGKTNWIESRFTDWRGATIPADISSYNHDLVSEVYRQAVPQSTDESRIATKALALVDDKTYLYSWNNTLWRMIHELGLSYRQVNDLNKRIFTGYPRLLERLQKHFGRDEINDEPALSRQNLKQVRVPYGGTLDLSKDILPTHDRYAQSHHLESPYPDVRFYVATNVPFPIVLSLGRECDVKDEEWWWTEIWRG